MRRAVRIASLGVAGLVGLAGALFACNSVLGINEASPEPAESGGGNSYTLDCNTYCNVSGNNCKQSSTQDDREYLSPDVCATLCPLFERVPTASGTVDPNEPTPTTDTLNCRIWHANAAQGGPTEAHTHCPHSGPLGGKMCGSTPCQDFCNLDLAFCTGDAAAYGSLAECVNACEPDGGSPDAGGYAGFPYNVNPADPEVSDLAVSGNTLNCRMYHLENFLFTGLALHCSHTSQSGGGVCVGP
jgi:hypothetical protein